MDITKSAIHVELIDRTIFKDIKLNFKQLPFEVEDKIQVMVQCLIAHFDENALIYQLDKEVDFPTDVDQTTPRRTIVVALPIYAPHEVHFIHYITAIKALKLFKRHNDNSSWEDIIKRAVIKCFENDIYSQLARMFKNGYYEVGEEAEKIMLHKPYYGQVQVKDAYEVLEFHSSGYVWLKEELRTKI